MTSSFSYEEDQDKKQILQEEFSRKLNLNVPLLSTKRPASEKMLKPEPNPITNSNETNQRVPFSWERTAGEPKDKRTSETLGSIIDIPLPPKPPPGRWQPHPVINEKKSFDFDNGIDDFCDFDDGCDGDADDECDHDKHDDHHENGHLSDTIDIFSLAESVVDDDDAIEENFGLAKDEFSYNNDFYDSPNFIIRRFLPDAQALAEASVMNGGLPDFDDSSFARAISVRGSYHSPKGCGLGSFFPFPWRMKPKPCGLKSPIRQPIKRRKAG